MKKHFLNLYFGIFGFFAKRYIKKHSPFVIGVTGSIGKTSSRMLITHILSNYLDKTVYTSKKNFNGELGLSLSILGISDYNSSFLGIIKTFYNSFKISYFGEKKYDIIFLEYGIDHIGEMDFLLSIVKPDISLITKIDKVHSSQFKSKNIIASEKYKLPINTKEYCYLNIDDEFYNFYNSKILSNKLFYTTNIDSDKKIDIQVSGYNLYTNEKKLPKVGFDILDINGQLNLHIETNIIGKENLGYIGVGFDILDKLYNKFYNKSFYLENKGKKLDVFFELQASRFNIFEGINNSIIVDSTYNASPLSMKSVIENTINLKNNIYPEYELILCLGEMRELGEYSQLEHENLFNFIKDKSNEVFVLGENMKNYFCPLAKEFGLNIRFFKNSKNLGNDLKTFLGVNENKKYLILFKGSQNTIFLEESIKSILKNISDSSKLCRQENFWLVKKNKFFN